MEGIPLCLLFHLIYLSVRTGLRKTITKNYKRLPLQCEREDKEKNTTQTITLTKRPIAAVVLKRKNFYWKHFSEHLLASNNSSKEKRGSFFSLYFKQMFFVLYSFLYALRERKKERGEEREFLEMMTSFYSLTVMIVCY